MVKQTSRPRALAIAAHPDDIEFVMAGTLLMLQRAGWEIHCLNVANGNLGSMTIPPLNWRACAVARRAPPPACSGRHGIPRSAATSGSSTTTAHCGGCARWFGRLRQV